MSEIKPVAYTSPIDLDRVMKGKTGDIYSCQQWEGSEHISFPILLYTKQQLDKAFEERDILIRDLRKELNERRYGRSAS